jgi:hypothetical protein
MARGREFFVYVIKCGEVPLYVGKGTGKRHKRSAKAHGGEAHILEWCDTDDAAFERERHWIAELKPENNKCPGGNGGRAKPRSPYDLPKALVGKISEKEWRSAVRQRDREAKEIEHLGSRRYVARFLCRKLNEANCEGWGVSKVDLFRLREVAHG